MPGARFPILGMQPRALHPQPDSSRLRLAPMGLPGRPALQHPRRKVRKSQAAAHPAYWRRPHTGQPGRLP